MKKFTLLLFIIIAFAACNNTEKPVNVEPEPAAIEEAEPAGAVARYTFAADIVDREPVWANGNEESIYFFTELIGLSGQTAHHLWQKNGEDLYDYTTDVTENRWRTYSKMTLANFKTGDVLSVSVTDGEGKVLAQSSIAIPAKPVMVDPSTKYLITSEGVGIFLTGQKILTAVVGYKITKTTGITYEEGMENEYDLYTVSENGQQLLSIENGWYYGSKPMTVDNINILSDKLKTSKNIGVGSTIDEFVTAYPDARLYFSCVSDIYRCLL